MTKFNVNSAGADRPLDTAPFFLKAIIFAWVLVVASENIKVEFLPYADWLATVPALACLLLYGRPNLTAPQVVFLTAIAISGFIGGDVRHAGIWCLKLMVIFLCTSCLAKVPGLPEAAFRALIVLMACNFVLLVLGLLGVSAAGEMMGAQGRYGTALCHPGALWHIGMAPLVYFACLLRHCGAQYRWVLPGAGVVACLALIWFDGSRTAYLMVTAFCLVPIVNYLKHAPHLTGGLLVFAVFLVPIVGSLEVSEESPLYRTVRLFQGNASWSEALESWDPARYEMFQRSLELIGDAPLLGNGFNAAVIRLDEEVDVDTDTMVVHNAYLQVWGEFGLAGVLAFIAILWGWTRLGRDVYRQTANRTIEERAKAINTIFMLVTFAVALLFHPVSTAWSDWILFAVPLAMLAQAPGCESRGAPQAIPRRLKWAA